MTSRDPQPPSLNGGEAEAYVAYLRQVIDEVCQRIDGLSAEQLNWRPPVPDANSIYVIATHILGNAEGWALGIACKQPVKRDRAAEFRSAGDGALPLMERARDLQRRIEEAVGSLPQGALGEEREAPPYLWGAGEPRSVTARWALMHVLHHAAMHLGHIDVTRDLARASGVT